MVPGSCPEIVITFYRFTLSFYSQMALEFTEPLTVITVRKTQIFVGTKGLPTSDTNNLTTICDTS
jgi:hypothetical protein